VLQPGHTLVPMLKFFSERRGCLAAIWIVLLLAGVLVWTLPRADTRAARLIQDRVGLDTEIDQAQWTFGAMELEGVAMRGSHGGIVARIDRVRAQVNPFAALFEGARAVHRITVNGADVTIDLRDPGLPESLEQARAKIGVPAKAVVPAERQARSSRPARTYEVTGLNVRVIDADGTLMLLRNVSSKKELQDLRTAIEEITIGALDADHVHSGAASFVLRRSEESWQLRELEVREATARSVPKGDSDRRALASRVRDAVSVLRSAPRAAAALGPAQASSSSPAVQAVATAPARLAARLSPDADISVSGIQIESRVSPDRVERLRNFQLRLRGDDHGSYRLTAAGLTTHKGTIGVDLQMTPPEARAEGTLSLRHISLALVAPFLPDLPLYDPEVGTLDAELDLVAESGDRVRMAGALELRELALASERIAPEPVEHINLDVHGKGIWHPLERRLQIEQGRVRLGRAQAVIEGELERTAERYRIELTAKLPPTSCNDVVTAIPKDLLGSLSDFAWSGTWSATGKISLDSRDLEATELSIRVRNLCQFERVPAWVRVERFRGPFRYRVVEPDGSTVETLTGPGTESWVDLVDVSPFVAPAIISHEDGAFYEHGGFAPWAIRDALVRNLEEGRYVVGASTISMQLAKNLYLEREKTIARKVQEVILTWWLENALTKDEILELYLNVIEYGPGVYGLRYAAAYYFGREPRELSPAESAFLACMLPSPTRYHVSYERGELTRSMKNRMRRLLEHMAKRERIGPEALAYGLAELDDFRFWRSGDPPPPPRVLPPVGAAEEPSSDALDPFEALFLSP
jgi:hypothetical protein